MTSGTSHRFIFEKWNYGWICGMDGSDADSNPMIVRYSVRNDLDTWPLANPIGGSSVIGGFDSYGYESFRFVGS